MAAGERAEAAPIPLVRAFEVWVPESGGRSLSFETGFYRGSRITPSHTPHVSIMRGQGLPGQVLERKAPMILEDLTDYGGFVRSELAARSGFSAGMGLPVLHKQEVAAVVTLLFATPEAAAGAFEIWQPGPAGRTLGWAEGFYGDLRDFEAVSRETSFDLGKGLPGQVLASGAPVLFNDLSAERGFLRSDAAARAGLAAALGFPVLHGDEVHAVVVLFN